MTHAELVAALTLVSESHDCRWSASCRQAVAAAIRSSRRADECSGFRPFSAFNSPIDHEVAGFVCAVGYT